MNLDLDDNDLIALDYAMKLAWEGGIRDERMAAALMNLRLKLAAKQKAQKVESDKAEASPEEENTDLK